MFYFIKRMVFSLYSDIRNVHHLQEWHCIQKCACWDSCWAFTSALRLCSTCPECLFPVLFSRSALWSGLVVKWLASDWNKWNSYHRCALIVHMVADHERNWTGEIKESPQKRDRILLKVGRTSLLHPLPTTSTDSENSLTMTCNQNLLDKLPLQTFQNMFSSYITWIPFIRS
jgi:hypothetical protein